MRKAKQIGCSTLAIIAVAGTIGVIAARIPPTPPTPSPAPAVEAPRGAPNILFVTVDDMNWDSTGAYGNPLKGITPNIDALAASGARFEHAFVTSPICQPSRSAWMTGRYPPSSGAVGFLPINPGVATLPETLRNAGWRIGILAKNTHTPPLEPEAWDYWIPPRDLGVGRDPEAFYRHTRQFIEDSQRAGRPFFLNANIQDPHRPFPEGQRAWWGNLLDFLAPQGEMPPAPPRFVKPAAVPVPGYLPDLPEVREELSQYYTAVHRADRSVGRILQALRETGAEHNTIVIFASDNGMAFPFAKQTLYDAGLRTNLIVRWPGKVQGAVVHSVVPAGVDIMPTLLEAAKLPAPKGIEGQSFLNAIAKVPKSSGEQPRGSTMVVGYVDRVDIKLPLIPRTELAYPSRSLTTPGTIYIWNGWAGAREFLSESQTGLTYPAMTKAADRDAKVAARVKLYLNRVPEELFDRRTDPDSLRNLVNDPGSATRLAAARRALLAHLERTRDPQLAAYRAYLASIQK